MRLRKRLDRLAPMLVHDGKDPVATLDAVFRVMTKAARPEEALTPPITGRWPGTWSERAIRAVDELLGGFGVEAIFLPCDPCTEPRYVYVNLGDPYIVTVIRHNIRQQWIVGCYGDLFEVARGAGR